MQTGTLSLSDARDLLLAGSLQEGLAAIEPLSEKDDVAALILAQLMAFKGDWLKVRSLCLQLLKNPFLFDPYHDVMQLFALSVIELGDWKEAKKRLAAARENLESMLDMSSQINGYAEAFNRFESYIWSEGKDRRPFIVASPVNYASMTKEQYARLCSLSFRTAANPNVNLSFDDLDESRKHHFHLSKALYDEALEEALVLYNERGEEITVSLAETLHLARLLMDNGQDNYAWQLLKPEIIKRKPLLSHEVVWMELLWNPDIRPLMTAERCLEILESDRHFEEKDLDLTRAQWERSRLSAFCSLSRCLTENAINDIEEHLQTKPDDLEARLKLIGAYAKYDANNLGNKKAHVCWLIEHYPDSSMIEELLPLLFLDKTVFEEDFEELKNIWLDIIERQPHNAKILFNAALLLGVDDKSLAEELLIRAQTIDPDNTKIAERLYELNAFQVNETTGRQRILHAREALRQIDIQEKLAGGSSNHTSNQLTLISRKAWYSLEINEQETCQKLLEEMIALSQLEGYEKRYLLLSRVIEGRLALQRGEIDQAVKYMQSTKESEPFKQMRGDNPLLTLMAELSAAGKKDEVIAYLDHTDEWPEEQTKLLESFLTDIKEDKVPWVSFRP